MKKSKILIVEDNSITAKDIENTIIDLGYKVTDKVNTIENVFVSIENDEPDIIIMDINLQQEIDGIELTKQIHKRKYIPVIYLTGHEEDEIMQRAIETNPVGYLVKPFNRAEIKSNILLGLYKTYDKNIILINEEFKSLGFNYYYDFKDKELFFKEKRIKLGIKEKKLLELLINANGQEVSFKNIEYEIWEEETVTKNTISVLAYRLKVKLGKNFIKNVSHYGFKLK